MKITLRNAGESLWRSILESILFAPFLVIIAAFLIPSRMEMVWAITFPLLYVIGYLLASALSLNRLYRTILIMLFLGALQGYAMLGLSFAGAVSAAASAYYAYRGLRSAYAPWSKLLPLRNQIALMAVYFFVYVIMLFQPVFHPYMPILTWLGLLAFISLVFNANGTTLKDANFSNEEKTNVSSTVLSQNRSLVIVVLLLALVITLFKYIRQAFLWVRNLLAEWLSHIHVSQDTPPPPEPAQQQNTPLPPAAGTSPAWMEWLDRIIYALIYIILAAAALYLLYWLGRKVPGLARRFYGWFMTVMGRESAQDAKGYEDDVELILDRERWNRKLGDMVKGMFTRKSRPKWSELPDNEAKVRYLYRELISKSVGRGYAYKTFFTPKETGSDLQSWKAGESGDEGQITAVYDAVRYGDERIPDSDIARLKQIVDSKK
jgi:hypothetical protein